MKNIKHSSLRTKIIKFILLPAIFVVVLGNAIGYVIEFNLMRANIILKQTEIASLASSAIERILSQEMLDMKYYASLKNVIELTKAQNLKYEGMSDASIEEKLSNLDREWMLPTTDKSFYDRYTIGEVPEELRGVLGVQKDLSELFITDKFGGLVASSGKTTDYYQADERWWQKAYDGGKGDVFIDNIHLDMSTGGVSLSISVPIRDQDKELIGIMKGVVNVERIFEPLRSVTFGKSGHAVLVNKDGVIIFHEDVEPLTKSILTDRKIEKILMYDESWLVAKTLHAHIEDALIVWTIVKDPILLKNGIEWKVLIDEDIFEAFRPLYILFIQRVGTTLTLVVTLFITGLIFTGVITRPLVALKEASKRISRGDLDFRTGIKSDDEIGDLSISFDQMTNDLRMTTTSIKYLNEEIAKRKEAEKKVIELAKFPEENSDPVMRVKSTGEIIYANKAARDFLGDCWQCKVGENLPDHCSQIVRESFKGMQSKTVEYACKDRVFYLKISPVEGSDYVNIYGDDITDIKKAETDFLESENRLKTMYEGSRDAIMVLNSEGVFVSANKATLEMFQCHEEKEFISKQPDEFSPEYQPDGKPSGVKAKEMIGIAIDKGVNFFNWTHKRLNGENFFATVLLSSLELKGETHVLATVRDITENVKNEEKIKKAAEEWERTFDSIEDFVFIQDADFNIVKANKSFAKLLNMKKEEIVGRKCYELLHDTTSPWPNCPFEKTKADSKPHTEEVDDPNIGVPLLVSTSPIFDEKGKIIGNVHIAKDIRERKRNEKNMKDAKDQLEAQAEDLKKANETMQVLYKEMENKNKRLLQIDKLKSNFVSMVSHELRTPLTAIKEGISIVLDGVAGSIKKEQRDFLNIAKGNVDRLNRLINDILDYQKLEAGKLELRITKGDINETVEKVVKENRPVIAKKKLKLNLFLDKNIPNISFDQDRIIQVLVNLLSNAIKFTDKGSIAVTTKRLKRNITVSISDTGVGIKKENMPKLFKSFGQLDTGKSRITGGTGLGLSISKDILKKHHGKIMVKSEYGKGSNFIFILPIK